MRLELKVEKKLKKQGYKFVIGLDEAGRGPLAGPVVAVAVVMNSKFSNSKLIQNFHPPGAGKKFKIQNLEVNDSKKLSPRKREKIYQVLKNCPHIQWGRGLVSAKVIDRINILEATKLAMRRAVKNLERKLGRKFPKKRTILILDGNQGIESKFLEMPIVKADETIFLCACASILAKVERDNLMKKYHKIYPQYNFSQHKGYPTKEHYKRIKKYGLSFLHRKTFRCG
jgi:ribonuclease HII